MRQDDDLFKPTLSADPVAKKDKKAEPWRVTSQLWVAFFGGVLPLTAIAYINSKRLMMSVKEQRQILMIGVAGYLLSFGLAYVLEQAGVMENLQSNEGRLVFRFVGRAVAVLTYLVIARQQRSAERIFQFGGGEYSSLWGPGLLAIIVLEIVSRVVLVLILWILIV